MKNLNLITVLLTWLMFSLPSLAWAFAMPENPAAQKALERYAKYTPEEIDGFCQRNAGARVDTEAGAAYKSACKASYEGAKRVAEDYLKKEQSKTTEIQRLAGQNAANCGGSGSAEGQKACMEGVANGYEGAAKIKAELSGDLLKAYKEAQTWRNQNAAALKKYRADQKAIDDAYNNAARTAALYRQGGDVAKAEAVQQEVQKAPIVDSGQATVAASNGKQSTISGYKQSIDGLAREQVEAQKAASEFGQDAKTQAYKLQQESEKYSQMAKETRAQMAKISSATSKTSISDPLKGKSAPIPQPRPSTDASGASAAKADGQTKGGGLSDTGGGSQGGADVPADTASGGGGAGGGAGIGGAAGALGGAAGGGGSMSGNSGAGYDMPSDYGSAKGVGNSKSPDSYNLGGNTPNPVPAEVKPADSTDVGDETKAIDESAVAAAGISGDEKSETSGSSSSPGKSGGENGKLGFSSAGGGQLAAGGRGEKEIAPKEQFTPNLEKGAVSIAGSDVKSAVAALAEEFGANLNLDLGDLTADEKAALAPVGGGSGAKSGGVVTGRATASLEQGSDESILDEQSLALFSRTRAAHERALKRGNLILGIKKKF